MTLQRGTRPDSSGPGGAHVGIEATKSSIAYRGNPMWPGIAWGHDAQCSCTWAMSGGAYQVKVRDASCTVHGGLRGASRG